MPQVLPIGRLILRPRGLGALNGWGDGQRLYWAYTLARRPNGGVYARALFVLVLFSFCLEGWGAAGGEKHWEAVTNCSTWRVAREHMSFS